MHELRVHSILAPEAAALYEALARHLASAAGLTASFASGGYGPFDRGEPDVVLVCSPPYVAMRAAADPAYELLGAPVLADPRFGGQPRYASDLIVRADCGAEALEDLRGAAVAYNEPRSWSGHWALRLRLARADERGGFFGRSVRAGYHTASLAAVIAGEAAAAAIDAHLLELLELRDRALPGRIRVLETLEPAPIQPVLVSTRLPRLVVGQLREALLSAHEDPAVAEVMGAHRVSRFAPVADGDYDFVRRGLEIAAGSPLSAER